MSNLTTKKILKAVGCDKLALYKGEGYWYFVYDDTANGVYDTHSVMSMYLGTELAFWVSEGKEFVEKVQKGD